MHPARFNFQRASWALVVLALLALVAAGCGNDPDDPKADAAVDSAAGDAVASETGGDVADDSADATVAPDTRWVGKCAAGPAFCDDGNPCTVDRCDALTGCYTEPLACKDDDLCTLDACSIQQGGCVHSPDNCDDGSVCTAGVCDKAIGCVYTLVSCEDGDACTSDGCHPITGCVHSALSCDDAVTCTVDSCEPTSGCVHSAPPGALCCENAADCEDDNACSVHACTSAGVCSATPIFACCKADIDCDDGNPCTVDACAKAAGVCSNAYAAGKGCCQNDSECDDGVACTLDRCTNGACAFEALCCGTAADCLAGIASDACATTKCSPAGCAFVPVAGAPGCCKPDLAATGFEAGADAWPTKLSPSETGAFAVVSGGGSEVHSGSGALKYAVQTAKVPGGKALARAKLATLELPAASAPKLRFWVRTQLTGGSLADKLRLRAETSLGGVYLWAAPALSSWTEVTLDLRAFAARPATRKLTLVFEVTPSTQVWAGSAAWIDDVSVVVDCAPKACSADADCDDGLGATSESCAAGACVYKNGSKYCEQAGPCNDNNACTADSCGANFACQQVALPGCCTKTAECNDGNPCTTDLCSGLNCKHTAKPGSQCCNDVAVCDDGNPCTKDSCPVVGLPCQWTQTSKACCVSALTCDDGDACTLDQCVSNACSHKAHCCQGPQDCDDGDDCTSTACKAGICTFALETKPGCCVPDVANQSFEAGSTAPLTLSSSLSTSKWQLLSGKQAKGGKGALWYGNLAKGDFDDGASNGTLTYAAVPIEKGEQTMLTFWLWMDTEMGTSYDRFEVFVLVNGKKIAVWDKNAPGFQLKVWHEVKIELSAFGGAKVDVQLIFDTIDGVANNGEGVYVDELTLTRSCAVKACTDAKACDDGLKATADTCPAGVCSYSY